jgi:ADP-L-glycero-D-manno-heptose 6-epimerase
MIIITGAAGFIGSCLVKEWLAKGEEIVLVDDFGIADKQSNLMALGEAQKIHRDEALAWIQTRNDISLILHIGARTDTTEFDYTILESLNLNYTKDLWKYCTERQVPFLYASSAATYGDGSEGYDDDHSKVAKLIPLNPYGVSKNEFDKWALTQTSAPPNWYGLKFFNVYGPNEYHKGRMASVILHAFRQIEKTNAMKLFRSHHTDYKDGEQLRDFVYVKDVLSVINFLTERKPENGLYNLGTGKARTFLALAQAVFRALGKEENISFMDTPLDIRDKYQYFTEANMSKLRKAGYSQSFTSLEDGVADYVGNYLKAGANY